MEEEIKPDRRINIKGLVCPYTFVKAKLAVEDVWKWERCLRYSLITRRHRSIPKSMEDHGQKVLKVEKINDTDWILVIRKEKE